MQQQLHSSQIHFLGSLPLIALSWQLLGKKVPYYQSQPVVKKVQFLMDGRKVFTQAVKQMSSILGRACQKNTMSLQDLDLIVPHQANQRIIDAMVKRNDLPAEKVFSNIEKYGNTSSNTIPICLEELWDSTEEGQTFRSLCLWWWFYFWGGNFGARLAC